ncbi:MAG: hypothetical protein ABR569_06630 [Gaiellaceae bacterium]
MARRVVLVSREDDQVVRPSEDATRDRVDVVVGYEVNLLPHCASRVMKVVSPSWNGRGFQMEERGRFATGRLELSQPTWNRE